MTVLKNRRLLALVACCAALVAVAAGCGGSGGGSTGVPKDDVAIVAGTPITKAQLQTLIDASINNFKHTNQPVPKAGSSDYKSLQQRLVQYLVTKTEFDQEAKRRHVSVTTKQIDAEYKNFIKQYFQGSTKKYQAELKKQGVTDAQVRANIAVSLLQNNVIKTVTAGLKVTDAEAQKYYNSNKSQYTKPESRHVAHILVKTKKLADQIYAKLQSGAKFATLAKKYTIDTSTKASGGDLGVQTKGSLVPAFEKVEYELKTGEISKPVHSQYGWHIIKALGPITPQTVTPFSKAKASIKKSLLQAKQSDAVSKFQQQLTKFYSTRIKYASDFAPTTTSASPSTSVIPTTAG
jgi:foldase protein PrsA